MDILIASIQGWLMIAGILIAALVGVRIAKVLIWQPGRECSCSRLRA